MNENMKDGAARVTARRRLIRGAFGAPAALTLYSGNVFAASSNLRALENQLRSPEYPGPVTELLPGDTWIRVDVYKWTDAKGLNETFVVSGAEVATKPGCGSSFVGQREWANLATSKVHNTRGRTPTEKDKTGEHAALRFNNKGEIVGVIPKVNSSEALTTALTMSAGTSLTGACLTPTTRTYGSDGFWK